jgi:hypothetical protein
MVSDDRLAAKPGPVTKYVIRGKTAKTGESSVFSMNIPPWCCGFLMAIGGHGHRA